MLSKEQDQKTIAFVLYPGLTLLDLVGPLQVLTALGSVAPEYRTVVVAERAQPMGSDVPVQLIPDRTFDEVPHPYVIVVPGGRLPTIRAMSDPALRAYVRTAAASAEIVASVCTGSLILAAAGLLDGRNATTHWALADQLNRLGAHYQRQRWVQDGKFLCAAGVSAGIDMALHLAAELTNEQLAKRAQLVIEYDPQPPFGGIDWNTADLTFMAPFVHQWIHEAFADHPDMVKRLTGGRAPSLS
jgi:transcriptional regulator GlxA family with amidase domain